MKYVFLDGDKIGSPAALHRAFAEALALPEYYGRNMDALHDCLTDIFEPVCVVAVHVSALREHLGRSANAFWRLMADLAEDRPGFRFVEEPFEN
jgi:ribonuclease inhibitor